MQVVGVLVYKRVSRYMEKKYGYAKAEEINIKKAREKCDHIFRAAQVVPGTTGNVSAVCIKCGYRP